MELQFRKVLSKYIPQEILNFVIQLFVDNGVSLVVTKNRKTKLGSFIRKKGEIPLITVNNNLNKYYFLVVLVHEFAHYFSWKKNKNKRIAPHGQQWKNEFGVLLKQLIDLHVFPEDIVKAVLIYIDSNFNSSKAKFELYFILNKYQDRKENKILLIDLEDGKDFFYNMSKFKKISTKNSRCLCVKMDDAFNRKYSFHLLTEIQDSI